MNAPAPSATSLPLVASDLLVAVCTPGGGDVYTNGAWGRVFGTDGLWGRLPLDDVRFANEYLAEATRGSLVTQQVFLVDQPADAEPSPVLLHFVPVRLPSLEAGHFPVVVTGEVLQEPVSWAADQTRRRRMEMLGQMTMGVAHDFNNLLTSILGHTELVKNALEGARGAAADEARAHLRPLERAASDGAALVRKIQQYIRHEKQERFEPVDPSALVEEVLTLTRPYWHNEPRRQGIAIQLHQALAPTPPVRGFATELREVLVNLILNAVQAMPAGGALTVRTRPDPARGVIVEVTDTGIGMPEHVRRRIFEPLFTTKGERGTGMGLTVAYGIVQEHNGAIEVESTPGLGTTFRLVFPAADPSVGSATVVSTVSAPATAPAPVRLLVVDDEPLVRAVTAKLLRLKGHTVDEAESGPEALQRLAEPAGAPYDLIITDLSMPDMSGRELAYHIRSARPAQPLLLLTGDTDAHEGVEHVNAVVQKPFKLNELEAVIQRVLGR